MACHPQGGVVLWAKVLRFEAARDWTRASSADVGVGGYRMEADGRVTPFAARSDQDWRAGKFLCDTTMDELHLPDWTHIQRMLVEPGGDVLLASGGSMAVLRFRRDGRIERVAGGGAGLCTAYPFDGGETGYRDGPAAQALFKGGLSLARADDGTIYVAEGNFAPGGGSWHEGNCSIRRIGTEGRVSTVYGNGRCEADIRRHREEAMTSVQPQRLAIDRAGRLLVVGSARGPFGNQGDGIFTKAHRIDPATGQSQRVAFAAVAAGSPSGRFDDAIGIAPDGTAVAFDDPSTNGTRRAGLVVLDKPEPALRYWWKAQPQLHVDGTEPGIGAVLDFCSSPDGTLYFLQKHALRRLDPKSGQMTTWLH